MALPTLKNSKNIPSAKKTAKGIKVSMQQDSAPLLPHERDQSTQNQASPVRKVIKQAAADVKRGLKDTDRGEEANSTYQKLKTPK
jgi:hypothetical protein